MSTHSDDIFSLILESQKDTLQAPINVNAKIAGDHFANWTSGSEGRLAIDVYDTEHHIVVLAPMAGVDPSGVEVHIHEDMLSIRGIRKTPSLTEDVQGQYHAECYWGPFSRSIVLPVDVSSAGAIAEYTHGLLTIHIPKKKTQAGRTIPIEIVEE
ncbi:MAG: heat-shock protein Hsp20 [Candidatus Magasanikbacteria bacterium GW2011_GWD2_43_18]|nr:MAG: heat-shock protein Hsp20 [Candidatus Magasanikbacteria bacterium GW2011_GWC2_42_27]KKT05126.1 MAG: heat-shock protein Hsp20 [Candidatus Magasanikbacteria bacterium GW2011_GWD2_43_18]KKT25783.1 MAG: heat-shock protein Hsp20 [Candidatus Magasanikbacteria bacterium GW2011_GWA2_43_9]HBB38069.1 hypothetical protein [Candidatus Magasanikbacteria bacterium]HCC14056.1 hypothetical protein [Candidatus Magasanikbacteria bacterium]